ncbi:hypothetical protein QQ045_000637 [Rhodiola kirilowii]
MGVPEGIQLKMVAIRLKGIAVVWWDKLVVQRRRQGKAPIQTRRMKQLMMERFLPKDYEQIIDKCYRCGGQGHRSNVCPTRRTVALLKEGDAEKQDEGDEYESVEFAKKESTEAVNIVLQRVLLATPDEGQRKNPLQISLFHS